MENDDLKRKIHDIGENARAASRILAEASPDTKNAALTGMADRLLEKGHAILEANTLDL